jgi:hypothetical protein
MNLFVSAWCAAKKGVRPLASQNLIGPGDFYGADSVAERRELELSGDFISGQ